MDKTALGISILNGEIKAATIGPGGTAESWESPAAAENLTGYGAVLTDAAQKTRAPGKQAAIVLAHPRLIDQVVEVPEVKGWKLHKLLHRRAQATKAFSGEAAWSYQQALPTKQKQSVLLHLCSKALVDQLDAGCKEAHLNLARVLPTTAVLSSQLKALPLQKDEVALLAAETGTGTTVVIGRKDGRPCLGRVLRSSWKADPDSVGVDLTRSIGFAEQQFGVTVNSVWLYGANAQEQAPRIETLLKLPVKVSPAPYSKFYWAEQAVRLAEEQDGNFLSVEAQRAPSRRRFLNLTVPLLCVLGLATLATAIVTERQRRIELKSIASISAKTDDLRIKQKDLQVTMDGLTQKKEMIRVVREEKPAPAPYWLLGYLSDAMPDGLVLSQFETTRGTNVWAVHLAGASEPSSNPPATLQKDVDAFTNTLANGPFHLNITNAFPDKAAVAEAGRRNAREKGNSIFRIDGVMQ